MDVGQHPTGRDGDISEQFVEFFIVQGHSKNRFPAIACAMRMRLPHFYISRIRSSPAEPRREWRKIEWLHNFITIGLRYSIGIDSVCREKN